MQYAVGLMLVMGLLMGELDGAMGSFRPNPLWTWFATLGLLSYVWGQG